MFDAQPGRVAEGRSAGFSPLRRAGRKAAIVMEMGNGQVTRTCTSLEPSVE